MTMRKKCSAAKLTEGPIGSTLVRLSTPMLIGILAMMAFNVIDTYFVGQLGTTPLAAMTLTFPVVMVIGTFTLGLGVGAMAVISKGIGAGDRSGIQRLATDGLSLAVTSVVVMSAMGLMTLDPLFRFLGATHDTLPLIRAYMIVWYPGMLVYVVPMIGNNVIRATGDTLTPSLVMMGGVLLNTLLDPLLIFGWGPVPALGIGGAAWATVIARSFTLVVSLWVLSRREHLLTAPWPGLKPLMDSWRHILVIGLPVAVSNAIIPISLGMITRLVTQFGEAAVAGFGVATRIEAFGLSLVYALSTGISPFVGQNFGAARFDRIREAMAFANRFCLAWGVLLFITFLLLAKTLVAGFRSEPAVIDAAGRYLWILAISLGLRGIHHVTWTSLNVLSRPYDALGLEVLLAFALWIPFAFIGAHMGQLTGLYVGLSTANVLGGLAAWAWMKRVISP
jgi:putative MATE family efflux protein